jgi:two-component system cell cycle sensor histidine kinase/response regulator CckA
LRRALHRLLEEADFNVWLAADGQEAVEVYQHHGGDIHLVLLDIHMPRRNGPQTLAALQDLNPTVCCCFMSGALSAENEHALLDRGAVHCFRKPFSFGELTIHLREIASTAASLHHG